jgi:hypothetical protein
VEQASLPSRLTLVLIQIHCKKEQKEHFLILFLMDLLSVVNLSKESSLLDTTIIGGSTHAYNLNKRLIQTRVAVTQDTAPWIGMQHGHLLFVVSNVTGGINSHSSISRS